MMKNTFCLQSSSYDFQVCGNYILSHSKPRSLYSLRVLKRVGVAGSNIIGVYKCFIRSILEYAVSVWQVIPEYLWAKLKSIQKRALNYKEAGNGFSFFQTSKHILSLDTVRVVISRRNLERVLNTHHRFLISHFPPK